MPQVTFLLARLTIVRYGQTWHRFHGIRFLTFVNWFDEIDARRLGLLAFDGLQDGCWREVGETKSADALVDLLYALLSGGGTLPPKVKERRFNFWALYTATFGGDGLVDPFMFLFLFDPAVVLLWLFDPLPEKSLERIPPLAPFWLISEELWVMLPIFCCFGGMVWLIIWSRIKMRCLQIFFLTYETCRMLWVIK